MALAAGQITLEQFLALPEAEPSAEFIVDDFREPPDIAIEIVSPEHRVTALVRRCLWYVAQSVRLALLIDSLWHTHMTAFGRPRTGENVRPLTDGASCPLPAWP